VLRGWPTDHIDACITDPPYGLSFMGKKWDYDVPSVEIWREVFRVLKPGGHLLAFGGTRTYHRLAVNVEDAGFEIRDQIQWLYGQGFPKSLDVSKAIDKAAGINLPPGDGRFITSDKGGASNGGSEMRSDHPNYTPRQSITDAAKQWEGWGTALKPANEPIVLARKPLEKGFTVAQNVQKWGTGAINVDGCRIDNPGPHGTEGRKKFSGFDSTEIFGSGSGLKTPPNTKGRFPSNVLLDDRAAELLDEQTASMRAAKPSKTGTKFKTDNLSSYVGSSDIKSSYDELTGGASRFFYQVKSSKDFENNVSYWKDLAEMWQREFENSQVSKFFYCPKASTSERNAGLEGMPEKSKILIGAEGHKINPTTGRPVVDIPRANVHPCVKPIKLMEYLCRLITPPGGKILDPFMGSGSTGIAAKRLGFDFIGIELNPEYFEIATRRIENAKPDEVAPDPQLTIAEVTNA
jgi:DNA modification methylase